MGFSFKGLGIQSEQRSWKETLIERIQDGKVLPIIGNIFTNNLAFKDHLALVEGWADYIRYPLADQQHDLPRMAQYESVNRAGDGQTSDELQIKEGYLTFLKEALFYLAREDPNITSSTVEEIQEQAKGLSVSQLGWHFNYPSLDSWQDNPLLLLAALPLPIYLTTSYHTFLEAALEKAGKEPWTDFCRWHAGLEDLPAILSRSQDYQPTPKQPLVYHLHGVDEHPASLVLTEDDHLDFLTYISKHNNTIHAEVTKALTISSLIMLGYSLRDWDFRVVFRGVIKPRPSAIRLKNVAIQLKETPLEQEFVKKYLRLANFEVVWSDAQTFIQELYQGYER